MFSETYGSVNHNLLHNRIFVPTSSARNLGGIG